jgi:hypothetical protein
MKYEFEDYKAEEGALLGGRQAEEKDLEKIGDLVMIPTEGSKASFKEAKDALARFYGGSIKRVISTLHENRHFDVKIIEN